MASSKTIDNEKQLQMLNLIIQRETDENKVIEFIIERANILFHMDKWQDVIENVEYLEKKNAVDNKILMMKWESMVQYEMEKIRNSMKNQVGIQLLDNIEYINLYTNINKENVHQLLNRKALNNGNTKRKKIM